MKLNEENSRKWRPKKSPVLVSFFALVSLVELHCAKTVSHFKDMTQIFQKALQYPRDLVEPLMNLKKSDLKLLDFYEPNWENTKSEQSNRPSQTHQKERCCLKDLSHIFQMRYTFSSMELNESL